MLYISEILITKGKPSAAPSKSTKVKHSINIVYKCYNIRKYNLYISEILITTGKPSAVPF